MVEDYSSEDHIVEDYSSGDYSGEDYNTAVHEVEDYSSIEHEDVDYISRDENYITRDYTDINLLDRNTHSPTSTQKNEVTTITASQEIVSEVSGSEGSGSYHNQKYDYELIKPKDYIYTTDDEDFIEGSGYVPEIEETEDPDRDPDKTPEPDQLTEEESKIR